MRNNWDFLADEGLVLQGRPVFVSELDSTKQWLVSRCHIPTRALEQLIPRHNLSRRLRCASLKKDVKQ